MVSFSLKKSPFYAFCFPPNTHTALQQYYELLELAVKGYYIQRYP